MKKLSYILGMSLVLAFSACDTFDLPNPPGQSNEPVPAFNPDDLAIERAATVLDLKKANDETRNVQVAKITKLEKFPTAFTLAMEMEVATSNTYENAVNIPLVINGDEILVNPDVMEGALSRFTKDPERISVVTRIAAFAVDGNTKVRLGATPDYWYGTDYEFVVERLNPDKVVEEAYYLVGDFCGWDVSKALKFEKTSEASVYDNPVFSIKIDVNREQAEAGYTWKVLPLSAFSAGNWVGAYGVEPKTYGPDETPGAKYEGSLVTSPEPKEKAGVITEAGPYLITINVVDETYNVNVALPYLWVPGNGSSNTDFSKVLRIGTDNYVRYKGVARLNRQWWLTGQASVDGINYKNDPDVEPVTKADGVVSGKFVDDAKAKKMVVPGNGLYVIDANTVMKTYKASPVNTISAIGDFNEWNLENAPELTRSADFLVWTIKGLEIKEAGKFKFCVNHAWTLSFGAGKPGADEIVENGGNISIEPGTYDMTLSFETLPYALILTKK